jgi:Cytochrome P450
MKKALSIVHGYTLNIIRLRLSKETELNGRQDMLSRFACNKDHNDVELLDVVTSFLLAGRETTSTALTWFFWLVMLQICSSKIDKFFLVHKLRSTLINRLIDVAKPCFLIL